MIVLIIWMGRHMKDNYRLMFDVFFIVNREAAESMRKNKHNSEGPNMLILGL